MEAVADGETLAARLVVAGRHRFVRHEQIMQAARPRHAYFVGGFEQRHAIVEQPPCMVEGDRLEEGFWAEAGPAREQFLQTSRRLANLLGKRFERWLVAIVK